MNLRKTLSILGLMLTLTIMLPVVHADDGIRPPGSLSISPSKFPEAFCRRERIFSNWSAITITLSRSSTKIELQ